MASIERCPLIKHTVIRDSRVTSRETVMTNPGGQLAAGVPHAGQTVARRLPAAVRAQGRNAAV